MDKQIIDEQKSVDYKSQLQSRTVTAVEFFNLLIFVYPLSTTVLLSLCISVTYLSYLNVVHRRGLSGSGTVYKYKFSKLLIVTTNSSFLLAFYFF